MRRAVLLWLVLLALLAGCTPAAPPATPTPNVPPAELDELQIRTLLASEADGVVRKDIDSLMSLWAQDGYVADAAHTPDNPADDLTWKGWYAVRDRYITLVFAGNAAVVEPEIVALQIAGDHAVVTATTHINSEVSPAGDRWTFVRTPAGWRIQSLTYNLEPR